jgi:hypothetical protein
MAIYQQLFQVQHGCSAKLNWMNNEDEVMRKKPGGLLDVIRKRPPLYLGRHSLSALWNFIQGYNLALRDHDLDNADHVLPRQFHNWARRRLQGRDNSGSVRDMILASTNQDEASALDMFFELYDEFRSGDRPEH